MNAVRGGWTAVLLAALMGAAHAAPRVPADDSEVLERLAVKRSDPLRRENEALRAVLRVNPRDAEAASRLAQLHIARARSEWDPRHLGQAQAVLAAWWNEPDPPTRVLLLRATIRQSNHEFTSAIADLANAARREPGNAQVWLTLATVQQVTGELDSARSSCRRLAALASTLVRVACLAAVEGASGNAAAALHGLTAAMSVSTSEPAAVRAWAATLQGELAWRLARSAEAEAHFRTALAADPKDAYAIAAYADFLLDEGRGREVMSLIAPETPSDPLLLRYVLAARLTGTEGGWRWAERLGGRFAASRARGDRVHLREEARFTLEILRDASGALALALENWKAQKEAADARLVLEAALAAGRRGSAREVLDWLARTRIEGRGIADLASRLERG